MREEGSGRIGGSFDEQGEVEQKARNFWVTVRKEEESLTVEIGNSEKPRGEVLVKIKAELTPE